MKRVSPRRTPGWAGLPRAGRARWLVPRGPRASAVTGLAIYQPVTTRGRLAWEVARQVARVGGFRLLPRAEILPAVRDAVAGHLPPGGTVSVWNATHAGRYVALLLDDKGVCRAVAKIGTEREHEAKAAREAAAIEQVAGLVRPPLSVPRLLAHEPAVLLFEFVPWRARRHPWLLPVEVAFALGEFFRAGSDGNGAGAVHGDCAPWNLLQTAAGWALVDWEEASTAGLPFQDVCHYFVQSHILLGRPSEQAMLAGFGRGSGRVGRAVRAYAEGAGLPGEQAGRFLRSYLVESTEALLSAPTAGDRLALPGRQRLLALLGS